MGCLLSSRCSAFISLCVVGVPFLGGTVRTPLTEGIWHLIVWYLLSLASVHLSALIVEKLAPSFQSRGDILLGCETRRLCHNPCLVGWVSLGRSVAVDPVLIAGLYAIYLFYVGVGVLMQTPAEKPFFPI